MCALWWGNTDGAFFDYNSIAKNRRIKYPMLPDRISSLVSGSSTVRIPQKHNGEVRILSADIALMPSRKNNNDATAVFINQLQMTKAGRYMSNIVYADVYEGLRTDSQALIIRKLYDEYQCDYIVLDTAGVGLGVFDTLAHEIVDHETGEIYPALSCCNDKVMAERCTSVGAEKVIWSVKASAGFNSDAAYALREGFRSGRIRLLEPELDAEKSLLEIKGYSSLDDTGKSMYMLPYIHTTLLIDELTRLLHEENDAGRVRVYERAGMRKDRYSSLSYNYYVALQIENKMSKRQALSSDDNEMFALRAPNSNRKAVIRGYGR